MIYFHRFFLILSLVLCLLLTTPSWAASTTLRTEITGIKDGALQNVQARLLLLQQANAKVLTPANINNFYKHAPANIKKALEPFGYFKAQVQTQLTQQDSTWVARFVIDPGPALLITQVNLQLSGPGKDNAKLQKLIRDFPIKATQIFEAEKYNKAKQSLYETANNEGYLNATLDKKEIFIDLKKYTAVITLHLNTGERYYFSDITFVQKSFTPEFLRRFLTFHEGEPYSSQKVLAFQQNLNNSHFFQTVNVTPHIQEAKNFQIPVTVVLVANKSQQYNAGVGYGTFTGPRVTLGMNLRHLTKTGHHLNLQLKLSSVISGLAAQYVIPGANPLTDEYTLGASVQRFLPKNGHSLSKTVSAGYVKTLHHWKNNLTLNYLRENSFINNGYGSHNSRILYPSYSLSHTVSDNIISPRSGHKVEFIVKGASNLFLSNTRFFQSELKAKFVFSPNDVSRIIIRGDVGYTVVKDLTTLPITLQFFSGGSGSVRAFPVSYEGPGRYLKVGSAEYQHRIIGKWNGAVFFDAGRASDHFNAPLDRSLGLGVIYDSLVGPIKFYVGKQFSERRHSYGIDFSIGPEL